MLWLTRSRWHSEFRHTTTAATTPAREIKVKVSIRSALWAAVKQWTEDQKHGVPMGMLDVTELLSNIHNTYTMLLGLLAVHRALVGLGSSVVVPA